MCYICGTLLANPFQVFKTITMKKSILLIASLILLGLTATSQNIYNLVIFSEDSEPFFAFVNGVRQNDKPETNIKITNLNSEALNVRIEFENKALPKMKQNMMPEYGYEHTINLKKNKKMEMKMRYYGKVALAEAPKSSATAVQYHTAENPVSDNSSTATNTQYNTSTTSSPGKDNTTVTTMSTSTQVNSNPNNVSVNVNLGGTGVGINMNVNDPVFNNGTTVSSTSSSTVTTSSSSSSTGYGNNNATTNTNQTTQANTTSAGSNYGCTNAINGAAYDKMKASIEAKPFSDTKMSTAKVATKNACLSATQIKGICALFSMDDDKLTYAKYAYDYCVDKANYYQVSEIFSFSSTTDELNKFLESH